MENLKMLYKKILHKMPIIVIAVLVLTFLLIGYMQNELKKRNQNSEKPTNTVSNTVVENNNNK